jgi:hypothetical protein
VCRKKEKAKTEEGPTQSHVSKAQTLCSLMMHVARNQLAVIRGNMTLHIISECISVSRTDLYRRKRTTQQGTSPHYVQRVHDNIPEVQQDRQCKYNVTMLRVRVMFIPSRLY